MDAVEHCMLGYISSFEQHLAFSKLELKEIEEEAKKRPRPHQLY